MTGASKDTDKQVIRGLRPLLEIPFLRLDAKGEETLARQLELLIADVARTPLSPAAALQVQKLIRNARRQAANGRFTPTVVGEEDLKKMGRIERLAYQLSQIAKNADNKPLFPEFIKNENVNQRKNSDDCGLTPHLMDRNDFIGSHTEGGTLFHGTPQVDNVLGMIRNGFYVSSAKQGRALKGRGLYLGSNRATSENYAGKDGIILELTLKESEGIRIFDWDHAESDLKNRITHSAESAGMDDPFLYLAERCGIDVIIHEYPLVQNSWVLNRPKNIQSLIKAYGNRVADLNAKVGKAFRNKATSKDKVDLLKVLPVYSSFFALARGLNLPGLPQVPDFSKLLDQLLKDKDVAVRREAATGLERLRENNATALILRALKDKDPEVRFRAVRACTNRGDDTSKLFIAALRSGEPTDAAIAALFPQYREKDRKLVFKEALKNKNPYVIEAVFPLIDGNNAAEVQELLVPGLLHKYPQVRTNAARALVSVNSEFAPTLFKRALADPDKKVAYEALNSLIRHKGNFGQPSIIKEILSQGREELKEAAQLLSEYSGPDIQGVLKHALNNPDSAIRAGAALALRNCKENCKDLFMQALNDKEVKVSMAAADCLGNRSLEDSFDLFQVSLRHPNRNARKAAARQLEFYSGPDVRSLFQEALFSNRDDKSEPLFPAKLSWYSGDDYEELYQEVLQRGNMRLKLATAEDLGKGRANGNERLFRLFLLDKDSGVSEMAARQLVHYSGLNREELFIKALLGSKNVMREAIGGLNEKDGKNSFEFFRIACQLPQSKERAGEILGRRLDLDAESVFVRLLQSDPKNRDIFECLSIAAVKTPLLNIRYLLFGLLKDPNPDVRSQAKELINKNHLYSYLGSGVGVEFSTRIKEALQSGDCIDPVPGSALSIQIDEVQKNLKKVIEFGE